MALGGTPDTRMNSWAVEASRRGRRSWERGEPQRSAAAGLGAGSFRSDSLRRKERVSEGREGLLGGDLGLCGRVSRQSI